MQELVSAAVHVVVGIDPQWRPHVHTRVLHIEATRHHADDGGGHPVDADRLTDHPGILAERPTPQSIRNQGDRRCPGKVFILGERPSELCVPPHRRKE